MRARSAVALLAILTCAAIAPSAGASSGADPLTDSNGRANGDGAGTIAPTIDPCATPRHAVQGLVHWLHPDRLDPAMAARCMDLSLESSAHVGGLRAQQLEEALNARGLRLDPAIAPSEADFRDESGRARYVPFPRRLPQVWVEQIGSQWLWSAATVAAIPALHSDSFPVDLSGIEERLPEWARGRVMGIEAWKLLGLFALILGAVVLRFVVMFLVASHARRFMGKLDAEWGLTLLARIDNPIGTLVAAGFTALLLPALQLPVRLNLVGMLSLRVVAAFSAVWVVYRMVDVVSGWLEHRASKTQTKLDDQLVPLVRTSLKIFIVCVGVVFVLQNLHIDVAGLLAGLGLGGLAFALAARETIANLFGAVTVFIDKPFQIGDWIVVDGQHGIVEQVGFRSTRLRTFYNSVLTVPNASVAGGIIDNYGAREYRRIFTTLGVTYDTSASQMQAFVEGIRAVIQANPYTRKDFYEIHFNEFGAHSLQVMVYLFVKVTSWSEELRERHKIFLEILRLAKDLGVDFAFPTQTLHLQNMPAPGDALPPRTEPDDMAQVIRAFGPGGVRARPDGPRLTHGYLPCEQQVESKAEATGSAPGTAAVAAGARLVKDEGRR